MGSFSSFPVLRERNGECPTNTIYVNHLIFVPTSCLIFLLARIPTGAHARLTGHGELWSSQNRRDEEHGHPHGVEVRPVTESSLVSRRGLNPLTCGGRV